MALEFACQCGLQLSVAAEYAGQDVQCPTCNAIVTAPKPAPKKAVIDHEPDTAPLKLLEEPEQPKPDKKRRVKTKSKSDKFSMSEHYDELNRKKEQAEKEIEERYEKQRKRISPAVIVGFIGFAVCMAGGIYLGKELGVLPRTPFLAGIGFLMYGIKGMFGMENEDD